MLPWRDWPDLSLAWAWLSLAVFLSGLGLLALGLIACALFPQRLRVVAGAVAAEPLACLGLGCLVYVVALGVSPLLLCALPLVWGALALAGLLGLAAVGIWVGEQVLDVLGIPAVDALRAALVGLLAIWLAALVPLLGWAAFAAAVAAGLGATIATRLGERPWPRHHERSAPAAVAGTSAVGGSQEETAPGER